MQLGELIFRLIKLFHKSIVGMETGNNSTSHNSGSIYITLEMIPTNNTTLSHFKSSFQNLILPVRIDFCQNKGAFLRRAACCG